MTAGCTAVICEPVFAAVNVDGQLMSRRAHTDKLDLCGRLGRPVNADPTVSAVAWSRAFRQNPPLKDPYTHPVLSCPPSSAPSLKTETTQDLKVKSAQKLTVPKA